MLANLVSLKAGIWLGLGLGGIILLMLSRLRQFLNKPIARFFPPLVIILPTLFFLGAWRFTYQIPNINEFHIAHYNDMGHEILVTGSLREPPDKRDTFTNLRLNVESIDTGKGDIQVQGMVLVRTSPPVNYLYGQQIRVRGKLVSPPENEDFSYRDYLARQGIHSTISSTNITILPGNAGNFFLRGIYSFKEKLLHSTHHLFLDPEASLLAGILLGVDTGMTGQLQNAFKNTGTAHIIAISGFNIAILSGIFFSLFKLIFKNFTGDMLAAILSIVGIFIYAFMVGADWAVLRAAVMGSLTLFARQVGRRNNGLNALGFVLTVMTVINPLALWDVGFQLSFFASLGLVLYGEPFSNFSSNLISRFSKHDTTKLARIFNDYVVLTFAAQLTTFPIMIYHFKSFPLISFLANPFILPVQPMVMVAGGLAVFTSLFIPPVGQLIAWLAWPFAAYTIHMVEFFDRMKIGTLYFGESSVWVVTGIYLLMFTVTISWDEIKKRTQLILQPIEGIILTTLIAILFAFTVIVWRATSSTGDGQLHITFFEAGSADAILIQTPEGRNVLINGGKSTTQLSDELGRRLPFFSHKLDWLVIASTREEQVASLPRVIEMYQPVSVLWSGNEQASYSAQTLAKSLKQKGIPAIKAEPGQRLALGDNAWLEVLAVSTRGCVLLLEYENFRAVVPIGIGEDTLEELELGRFFYKVDILLLADAGYAPSNPPEWIANLKPQLTILSVEMGDPDGLPSQAVLDALDGYALLRTDVSGWISIKTDGQSMHVQTEHGQ